MRAYYSKMTYRTKQFSIVFEVNNSDEKSNSNSLTLRFCHRVRQEIWGNVWGLIPASSFTEVGYQTDKNENFSWRKLQI